MKGKYIKSIKHARPVLVRTPRRHMFLKIEKISKPKKLALRWDNYKDGMTILDVLEGNGTSRKDVAWYCKNGHMRLLLPTEDEYQEALRAWRGY